jgi:hypothetical protein
MASYLLNLIVEDHSPAETPVMLEAQPMHWKDVTRAVRSEEDPQRILDLLRELNQSLELKARELAKDLLETAA